MSSFPRVRQAELKATYLVEQPAIDRQGTLILQSRFAPLINHQYITRRICSFTKHCPLSIDSDVWPKKDIDNATDVGDGPVLDVEEPSPGYDYRAQDELKYSCIF